MTPTLPQITALSYSPSGVTVRLVVPTDWNADDILGELRGERRELFLAHTWTVEKLGPARVVGMVTVVCEGAKK